MAGMREEAAGNNHAFIIWPHYTRDYLLKVSHVSCGMLQGLWVMKNIWRMSGYQCFPSNSSFRKMESNYETLQWDYNDSHFSAVSQFNFEYKVHVGKTHSPEDSSQCSFRTARGHVTELAKAVSSCVHIQTYMSTHHTVTPVYYSLHGYMSYVHTTKFYMLLWTSLLEIT